ncbi:AbiV family abortive infection protein [Priestia megaterium]|uniref:AbiV family abortive infection protein n=1 Tax=Priestia megaterium TaxID=1404 RepID=UPI001B39F246|nr:AbiV family abortive infection protein [Priestia megaterium]MBQ4867471.1 AbiV family abortive infection protein [Priestia megaterium]
MTALSFGKLEEAYIFAYENAEELLQESRLLYENKRYARSYTLAQFAHEELAKLPIIYQEATRSFFKESHDWKEFHKRLRSHESKNKLNFVLQQTMLNMAGSNLLDLEPYKIKDNLAFINHMKNVSIYSDIKNNKYTKPSNEIKKSLAKAHLEVVEEMFKTTSKGGFHIKGAIKKSLDNDKAKIQREMFRKLGLIK